MTQMKKLSAEDGHTFDAAVAGDPSDAHGGVVALQEIFGLNAHIRPLPARFAMQAIMLWRRCFLIVPKVGWRSTVTRQAASAESH